MNWNKDELEDEMTNYFDNTQQEQIINDMKEAGFEFCKCDDECSCETMKLFTLEETVKLFVGLFEGIVLGRNLNNINALYGLFFCLKLYVI